MAKAIAWATVSGNENLVLRSLLSVNSFDVELTKQAFAPMYSSLSLTTLSNVPPQDSPLQANSPSGELLPIKCPPNARGGGREGGGQD